MDNSKLVNNDQGSSESKRHGSTNEVYRFKVKNRMFESTEKIITGRRVCELAGLIPPKSYQLSNCAKT